MIRKLVLTSIAGCMLAIGAMGADIVVKVAPPRARVEKRAESPGTGYVYTNGYHRWDGNAYQWTPGEWKQPPNEHSKWVDHRWDHRKDGYVFTEGHWQ
jgi:hypothetical protein